MVALQVHDAQPYDILATAQESQGNAKAALATYTEALRRFPYNQILWYNQGVSQGLVNDYPAALASWQRSLELSPLHGSTHYQLAQLAIRQGQPARALISLLTFLSINPDSRDILILAEQISSNALELDAKEKLTPFVPNEAFRELDLLINSKAALRKDYNSKVKFNANVVKQAQLLVEKFPVAGPNETDLWLRAYTPLIQVLRQDENLIAFTYLILSSADDKKAAGWVKSNKGKIDKMVEAAGPAINQFRAYQTSSTVQGKPTRIKAWFTGEGKLEGLGDGEGTGEKAILRGPWQMIDEEGAITEEGSFSNAGNRVGTWRSYHINGRLEKELAYDAEGKLHGRYVEYHDNGALSVEGNYEHGQPAGVAKLYHYCGTIREVRPYAQGDINGEALFYYTDGKLQRRTNYKSDKKEGIETGFYADGTPEYTTTYMAGKRQGAFTVYYADKALERKGSYDQDEMHGPYTEYHANGQVESTGTLNHGKLTGPLKLYYTTGKLSVEKNYDAATGELHGPYRDYDFDGKLLEEQLYDQGRVTRVSAYDAGGKMVSQTPVAKKGKTTIKGLRIDGTTLYTGSYLNGQPDGEWVFLHRNGATREVRRYASGVRQGLSEEYYATGKLKQRYSYVNDELDGFCELFYPDGVVQRAGFYQHGQEQGEWRQYYADGTLSEQYNLLNGTVHGQARSFTPTRQLTQERWLEYGRLLTLTAFDSTGKVVDRFDITHASKKFSLHYPGGKPRLESALACYEFDGPATWFSPSGKTELSYSQQQGNRHGAFRSYHPTTGKIAMEGTYRNGQREGEWKQYYDSGKLRSKGTYRNGEEEGEWQYLFENGQPDMTRTFVGGELQGPARQHNMQGELLVEKMFERGEAVSFRGSGSDGKPTGAYQALTGILTTQFANGKPATVENYKGGRYDGTRTYYYSNGQVFRRVQNQNGGVLSGLLTTYYPDGKLREEENYAHDELHGRSRYYRPDGTLEREESYRSGEKSGPTIYYNAQGKPVKTEVYWNTYVYDVR
ncbi:hypothetical protein GCM10011375_04200 [Hymenobacter qilianensis]|uniref:Uncharacterized protein n=1 Tax=Hymenobacter qilianensis TaxID=1385715 RepID=A0ACB5PM04_9BACT|nr:hypothetical protein GCM10011375_04200 [Hymenobacter qilianensis]